MDLAKLLTASEVLTDLSQQLATLPEEQEKATAAAMMIVHAAFCVTELAYHLEKGKAPSDALLSTVRGEMPIKAEHAILLRLLTARGMAR